MFGIGPHKNNVTAHHMGVHDVNFGVPPQLLPYTPCTSAACNHSMPEHDVFEHAEHKSGVSIPKILGFGLLGATALLCHKKVNDLNFFLRNGIKAAGAAALGLYALCVGFKD